MNNIFVHYAGLAVALCTIFIAGCTKAKENVYAYHGRVTTGLGHCIVIDGKPKPIVFSPRSNPQVEAALIYLRPEIADVAQNKIWLHGRIEKRKLGGRISGAAGPEPEPFFVFNLSDWEIDIPFHFACSNLNDITEPPKLELRSALRRSDFVKWADFNPDSMDFDPSRYEKRRVQ